MPAPDYFDDERAKAILQEMNEAVLMDVSRLFNHLQVTPEESKWAVEHINCPGDAFAKSRRHAALALMAGVAQISETLLANLSTEDTNKTAFSTMGSQRALAMANTLCLQLEFDIGQDEISRVVAAMMPLAMQGKRFKGGRKLGTLGPIAQKVQVFLEKSPRAKTESVWAALKKSPPRGHVLVESDKLGRYIELGAKTVMEWPRFRNVVSERRAALKVALNSRNSEPVKVPR